jgi:alkylated DNA repair dioxygenase AlkB
VLEHVADGGTIYFADAFLSAAEADRLFAALQAEVPWKQERTIFGHLTPRLTAWVADAGVVYRYSGITHEGSGWSDALLDVRRRVEHAAETHFNSVLLNRFRDGNDSMGYHADDEPELGTNPVIASLSLGSARTFVLRHEATGEKRTYELGHGSLLIMGGALQHHWKHAVPKTKAAVGERINLTFRQILASLRRG